MEFMLRRIGRTTTVHASYLALATDSTCDTVEDAGLVDLLEIRIK
jgi:hypothetical protein